MIVYWMAGCFFWDGFFMLGYIGRAVFA
jgi:hypothetical protein